MLTHLLCKNSHADASEVIDRETRIPGLINWEDTGKARAKDLIFQALLQSRHTKRLRQILEQNFDEYPATRCSFVFVEVYHAKDMPAYGVGRQHMAKQSCYVAQLIRFSPVNGIVGLCK
jgi:hypothetical protein